MPTNLTMLENAIRVENLLESTSEKRARSNMLKAWHLENEKNPDEI